MAGALDHELIVKLQAHDFRGVVDKCNQVLALNPTDTGTLGACHRALGYAYAYLGDPAPAKKNFRLYLPFATSDRAHIENYIATH